MVAGVPMLVGAEHDPYRHENRSQRLFVQTLIKVFPVDSASHG
jgi:hypothetical protein